MPAQRQMQWRFSSGSPRQTEELGRWLGQLLRAGDVICLTGGLGAGKTTFCRGIGAGWGAMRPLTSPTYNLVHEHWRAGDEARLFHIDCYRLRSAADADAIGLDDILDSAATALLEWCQRIQSALPADRLRIDIIDDGQTRRHIVFYASGERHAALLAGYQRLVERNRQKDGIHAAGN